MTLLGLVSLSARRAWIEIPHAAYAGSTLLVALRKESVDRNPYIPLAKVRHCESLSARRAWIEMVSKSALMVFNAVALRKESVDRNCSRSHNRLPSIPVALRKESVDRNLRALKCCLHLGGRSPQGERG